MKKQTNIKLEEARENTELYIEQMWRWMIERSEHAHLIQANKERIETNPNYYRRRQAIVEHPYGTIKRQWGFNYIMTKRTMKRASADVGLIFTAYNLRRILNIIGIEGLRSYLIVFLHL